MSSARPALVSNLGLPRPTPCSVLLVPRSWFHSPPKSQGISTAKMAGDSIENASHQLLVGLYRLLAWCLGLLLPVLDGVFTTMVILSRATYNIAYQLSFRWHRDPTAADPMDDYLPRAKGDLPQEAYTYAPLPGERHIRILQLKQPSVLGLRGSVIECDLLPVSLDNPGLTSPYRAISYSWDGQTFDRYILCGGKKLAITKNCEDILRHMLKHVRFFIWIDAICIDQGSSAEKAVQVPLMTEIYGRAHLVNVWLGLPAEGTGLVFSYVWLFWCCLFFPERARTWLETRLHGIIEGEHPDCARSCSTGNKLTMHSSGPHTLLP